MITDLKELLEELNEEPDEVKENEDKSKYVPISVVQNSLDSIFGFWNWDLERDQFGKGYATGKGVLTVIYPDSRYVRKSGTAGISLSGDLKLDYPRLEAMCLLNAAKKLGRRFGRDLNRGKEDEPLPVTQLREENGEESEINKELKMVTEMVKLAPTKEEALSIMKSYGFSFNTQMKEIANSKLK